jgi:hypothetical protein
VSAKKIARTRAEADAQIYILPSSLDNWRECAALIDGYRIAEELGLDLLRWGGDQQREYDSSGEWKLGVLGLRLMLFYAFRADHMGGYTYHEHDAMADSLLRAVSAQTGLPYPSETVTGDEHGGI